jgi:soluble lytic murein transglycosylase
VARPPAPSAPPADTAALRRAQEGRLGDAWTPALAPPRLDEAGRVSWTLAPGTQPRLGPVAARLRQALTPDSSGRADSLGAWSLALTSATLRPAALRRLGPLYLACGDSAAADSCWAALAAERSPWRWEAVRSRSALALDRGDTTGADSLLEAADRDGWPDADRAAWIARRAELRAALGDTARAAELGRQTLRRYPSLAPAAQALGTLEALARARGDSLSARDERDAAEVEFWRGDRVAAAGRLGRALARWSGEGRDRVALRRAEVLRLARRFAEAERALVAAMALAAGSADSARGLLERARLERDAGRLEPAFADYARCARIAPDPRLRETAYWERAREREADGRWGAAEADYARTFELGLRRAGEAAFRAGLMAMAAGGRERAADWWARGDGEASRFWRAIAVRGRQPAAADSTLATLAAAPGYSFYSAAARETLGARGWPGAGVADGGWEGGPAQPAAPGLGLAEELAGLGFADDAAQVLTRWAAEGPRAMSAAASESGDGWAAALEAARIAYAAGRLPLGIRFAQAAFDAAEDSTRGLARRWAAAPWLYPPAFDSLFDAFPDSAGPGALDRPLLMAVAWQESRFDPAARSRSDALGLMQLKLPTAQDVARGLGEPAPDERALFDPAVNLRLGVAYLRKRLAGFDGQLPAALAAYNAGWRRVPAFRHDLLRRGGEALLCELVGPPETQDYVKKILAARDAYRELRPLGPGRPSEAAR